MGSGTSGVSSPIYQQPILSEQINKKTNDFVKNAEHLVQVITKTDSVATQNGGNTTIINNYYDTWWCPYRPYYFHPYSYIPQTKTQAKEDLGRTAVIFGGLTVIYAIYGVAKNIGSLIGIQSERNKNNKFANWFGGLVQNEHVQMNPVAENILMKMAKIKERIFSRTQTDTEINLLLKGALGVGGGILATGGWYRDETRMKIGLAFAIISAVSLIIQSAVGYAGRKNEEDAHALRQKIDALKEVHEIARIEAKNATPIEIESGFKSSSVDSSMASATPSN